MKDMLRAGAAIAAAALLTFSGQAAAGTVMPLRENGKIFRAASENLISDRETGESALSEEDAAEEIPAELAGEAPSEEYRFDEEHAGDPVYGTSELEDGSVSISLKGFYRVGTEEVLEVPGEIDGKTVTAIDDEAFCRGLDSIVKVVLPDSITAIGDGAFADCTGLTEVVLGSGVKKIGREAFAGCSSLENLELPAAVTEIGEEAFARCSALTLSGGSDEWQMDGSSLYHGTELWFVSAAGEDKVLRVKEGTTRIAPAAAMGNGALRSVILPDSLTQIGERAFAGCENLSSPVIPGSVSEIGDLAFEGCTSIDKAVLPSSLKNLGSGAFAGTGVTGFLLAGDNSEYAVEDGVLFSGKGKILYAYPAGAGRTLYRVPDTVTMIAKGAFRGTDVRRVLLPETLTLIEEDAFREAQNLRQIRLPSGIDMIGPGAFYGCSDLVKVSWEAKTETVPEEMFARCTSLEEICFPRGIVSIDNGALAGCTSLKTVILPVSLQRLGALVFDGCISLGTLRLPLDLKYIDNSALGDPEKQRTILKVAGGSSQERWAKSHGFRMLRLSMSMYEHYVSEEQPSGWELLTEKEKQKEYEKKEIITQVQIILNGAGYTCGNADGVVGNRTKEAIRDFRADRFMTDSDEIDEELLKGMGIEPTKEAVK